MKNNREKLYKIYNEFKTLTGFNYKESFEVLIDLLTGTVLVHMNVHKEEIRKYFNSIFNFSYSKKLKALDPKIYDKLEELKRDFLLIYILEMSVNKGDILGEIFERAVGEFSKPVNGQFFTPDCVSKLLGCLISDKINTQEDVICINDPCVGFGSLVINSIHNYPKDKILFISINDIDQLCVKASLFQILLALNLNSDSVNYRSYLIQATVANILTDPNPKKFFTIGFNEKPIVDFLEKKWLEYKNNH